MGDKHDEAVHDYMTYAQKCIELEARAEKAERERDEARAWERSVRYNPSPEVQRACNMADKLREKARESGGGGL